MFTYYFGLKLIMAAAAVGTAAIIISLGSLVSSLFTKLTTRVETATEAN